MVPVEYSLILGCAVFCAGLAGVLTQRHAAGMVLAAAVMYLGVVYSAVSLAAWRGDQQGVTLAVSCAVASIAIVTVCTMVAVVYASVHRHTDTDKADQLRW